MDKFEWVAFYHQLQLNAAANEERYKKLPGVTVCNLCGKVQFPQHFCSRCKTKKMCLGHGDLCCECCEEEAKNINWDEVGFVEDDE